MEPEQTTTTGPAAETADPSTITPSKVPDSAYDHEGNHAFDAQQTAAEAHDATEHGAEEAHAHEGDHGHHDYIYAGRYPEHPPEPPHLIQMWWKGEQSALKKQYAKDNGVAYEDIKAVEPWMEKNEDGEWEISGTQSPASFLHVGSLKEPMPLIGYAPWENHVYFGLACLVLIAIFWALTSGFRRDRAMAIRKPSRAQYAIETLVGTFDEFCKGLLGEVNGRRYMPFVGTIFCLILVANFLGMIPVMRAPTAYIVVTFSLALCTFITVQATAWSRPGNYLYHLMGQPTDAFTWVLGIVLFLPLEIISDFVAKPVSLAFRLFGNVFGKDILLGVFMTLGISLVGLMPGGFESYIGVPLTVPFLFLGILFSTIQALVFALLSCIYLSLVLPHDHDHHDHDHVEHASRDDVHGDLQAREVHDSIPT